MKKKLLFSIIALLLLVVLCACSPKDKPDLPNLPDTPSTEDNGGEQTVQSLTLTSAGTSTEYKLLTTLPASYADEFISRFALKTGVTLQKAANLSDGKLIVLCPAEALASIEGLNATPSFTSYQIKVIGNNVFIPVSTSSNPKWFETTFAVAVNKFISTMQKDSATGSCTIAANTDISADISGVKGIVPMVEGDGAVFSKIYVSGSGNQTNYQMCYLKVNSIDTVKAYTQKLSDLGYTMSQENNMNGNLFATFVNAAKDSKVHINWFKVNGRLNIVYGKTEYVPSASPVTDYQKKAEPTLSMLKLTETGLSMVAQLEDGSFIIVDGGENKDANKAVLWNYLKQRLPAGESKPRITWIFTHNHSDHIGLPTAFLKEHKDDIQLDLVIYNFPDFKSLKIGQLDSQGMKNAADKAQNLFDVINTNFKGTPTYRPHTGEKLCLPGCELEFIFVQEDASHITLQWLNDTSMVFRIKMGDGKTCMVYADAEKTATDYIYSLYGNYLKSDIMQVPHHGRGGSSWELYSATDPYICLWSVPGDGSGEGDFNDDMRTGKKAGFEYNKKLRDNSIRQRLHYHHSVISVVNMNNLTVTNPAK